MIGLHLMHSLEYSFLLAYVLGEKVASKVVWCTWQALVLSMVQ